MTLGTIKLEVGGAMGPYEPLVTVSPLWGAMGPGNPTVLRRTYGLAESSGVPIATAHCKIQQR